MLVGIINNRVYEAGAICCYFFLNSFVLCHQYIHISTFPHFHISTFLREWILKTLIQAFYLQLYDIKPILDLLQLLHSLIILSLKSFNLIINALIYQNMSDEIIISSP